MSDFSNSRVKRLALASLLVLATCGAVNTGVRAEEEGELVKGLLGKMGFIPEDKDPIHYRERAPLVLPKSTNLPPPVEGGFGERKLTNWPNDPDIAAARARSADVRKPRTQTEAWRANQGDGRLPAEKLKATRSAGRDPNDRTPVNAADPTMNQSGWIHPEKMSKMGTKYKDGSVPPGGEPTRDTLADPPTGYRKAAGGGTIKPTYDPPDKMDPASPYYLEHQRRKQAQEN